MERNGYASERGKKQVFSKEKNGWRKGSERQNPKRLNTIYAQNTLFPRSKYRIYLISFSTKLTIFNN